MHPCRGRGSAHVEVVAVDAELHTAVGLADVALVLMDTSGRPLPRALGKPHRRVAHARGAVPVRRPQHVGRGVGALAVLRAERREAGRLRHVRAGQVALAVQALGPRGQVGQHRLVPLGPVVVVLDVVVEHGARAVAEGLRRRDRAVRRLPALLGRGGGRSGEGVRPVPGLGADPDGHQVPARRRLGTDPPGAQLRLCAGPGLAADVDAHCAVRGTAPPRGHLGLGRRGAGVEARALVPALRERHGGRLGVGVRLLEGALVARRGFEYRRLDDPLRHVGGVLVRDGGHESGLLQGVPELVARRLGVPGGQGGAGLDGDGGNVRAPRRALGRLQVEGVSYTHL